MNFSRIVFSIILVASNCGYSLVMAQEFKQTWESKYIKEPYLILYKERVIKINKDYSAMESFHKRAIIQTEEGKSLGELQLPYDKSREDITDVDAYTITPTGNKQRYVRIQDLSDTPASNAIYSENRKKIITMPGVVKGSIIEWKGTHVYKTPIMTNNFFDHFHFTYEDYPVKENVCQVIAPKSMKLYFRNLNTAQEPKIENREDEVIYTWISKDNDKVELEELMPPKENANKIIFISTINDWNLFSNWVWALFHRNTKITPEIKQKVRELTRNKMTTGEKVQAIIEYIQSEFRYVAMNLENHHYEPHAASEIFTNKYGDCKDLTLLSMSMLSEIGVKAWPAFSSSIIDLRREELLPMLYFFDHAFLNLEVDGKQYFTDVLVKGYHFDEIPAILSGKKVFIANDHGGTFSQVPLANDSEVSNSVSQTVHIHDDGTALVDLEVTFSNSISVAIKQMLKSINDNMKEKFFAGIEVPLSSGGKLIGRKWENLESPFSRIFLKLQLEHPNWIEHMGDMMTFGSPQVQRQAAFSAPKRKTPIVFTSTQRNEKISTYILPVGYELLKLPRNVSIQTSFADFARNYTFEGGKITEKETIRNKPVELSATEYHVIQSFFSELTKQTAEKIIIKKTNKLADVKK